MSYWSWVSSAEGVDWRAGLATDRRYASLLDHLLLRFVNMKSQRTHFPLILASDFTFFFNYEIFSMAKVTQQDYFLVDPDLYRHQFFQKFGRTGVQGAELPPAENCAADPDILGGPPGTPEAAGRRSFSARG